MKKVQKRIRTRPNFKKLKEPETKEKVVPVLNNKFQDSLQLEITETTENLWQSFKNVIHEVQENELGTQERRA